ncbi:hypothetical protein OHS18_45885 [Amycolatopsis sp. NBC_00355]|uniref:hypothetical protein n=1 Tax=Amycolatopsis sp. NBC_00355 TaxID=2975957 RepID=UPI002E252FB0
MIIRMDDATADGAAARAKIEAALRWLAIRKDGTPLRFLRYAIKDPTSESACLLGCLVEPTTSLSAATPESRAFAMWGLIVDEIGKLGSAEGSRRRNTLIAAFRLSPIPVGETVWKATLDDRFRQLIGLPGVFGDPPPTTTTPMHKAWRRAVGKLADCVLQKLDLLRCDGQEWQNYVEIGLAATKQPSRGRTVCGQSDFRSGFRAPSSEAQPVFLERMVVTVVMHREMVLRRTTERDVIACEDGVDVFDALASVGRTSEFSKLPVKAIWACSLVARRAVQPGDPTAARLRFRKVLRRGDRYHFVSETWDDHLEERRSWINVDVDHHGIAAGTLDEGGRPVAGLTMQVNFDQHCLPEACWWYAETDLERLRRPPAGDLHLLEIGDGFAQHTFEERCQPRENYGIAFRWPPV